MRARVDPRHPHVRTTLYVVAGLASAVLAIGAIFLTATIYDLADAIRTTQISNTERDERDRVRDKQTADAAEAAARAVQRIEDCTTPGLPCFEASQRRTGEAIVGINQGTLTVIVAALSCQDDGVVGQRALARCTAERAQAESSR